LCLDAVFIVFQEIQFCVPETRMECSCERLEAGGPKPSA